MTHNKEKLTIYKPNQRLEMSWFNTWKTLIMNVINSWELIYQLWRRDYIMQYKKSFLGFGWVVAGPIMGIVSWVFMNAAGVLAPGDVGVPYPVYVLLSSTIWGLFMGFYGGASSTLQVGQAFIMQVNFSHDALLVKQGFQQISSFGITFTVSLIVLFAFGVVPSWKIIFFPLMILPIFMFAASLGLMISVIKVVLPDFVKGFAFFMSLLMYITPVIYSPKLDNPFLQTVIKYNPLTYIVCGPRDLILYGAIENLPGYFISTGATIVFFLFIWRLFFVTEHRVIEKLI